MTVFAIMAPAASPGLQAAIERSFANNFLKLADNEWLVAANDLTTQQIGERLGPKGENGKFVVVSVVSYWGYHDRNIWEWLKVKTG